jgi:hypothetical protein
MLDGKFQMGGKTLKSLMSADDTRSGWPSSPTCVGVRKELSAYPSQQKICIYKTESEMNATHISAIILFQTK